MTMTNGISTEQKDTTYRVLVGKTYEVTRPLNFRSEDLEAGQDAIKLYKEEFGVTDSIDWQVAATVDRVDGEEVFARIPKGVSRIEAERLLKWAVENADRELIDFDALAKEIEEEEKYSSVRGMLDAVPVDIFATWLCETSALTFGYEVTEDALIDLAKQAEDNYLGQAYDPAEFTQNYYEEAGELAGIPSEIEDAIDWEQVWNSALCYDVTALEVTLRAGYHFFSDH